MISLLGREEDLVEGGELVAGEGDRETASVLALLASCHYANPTRGTAQLPS